MTGTEPWFEDLYRRHRNAVLAYCLRRTGPADADDAVAQVFTVAWRRREDMPRGDNTLPWLYGVARNVLSHQWRSASRVRRLSEKARALREPGESSPERVILDDEEHAQVRRAVAQLRPADREVLMLSAWEELSHAEMAEVLGCSTAAVDKRLQRAKQRLQRQYDALAGTAAGRAAGAAEGGGRS
jgi:RNA polymerase sigma-70 factor (ECF subfamily)